MFDEKRSGKISRRRALEIGAQSFAGLGMAMGLPVRPAFALGEDEDFAAPGTPGLSIGIDALRWQNRLAQRIEFSDFSRLGVRWLRIDLRWNLVQPENGNQYDWSSFDTVVALAREYDLEVLPVVGGTPEWARIIPEERSTPANVQDFADFLTKAVERYQSLGVRAWEVWNEPNMATFWPPEPDPVAYARLLKASYAAIKAADPLSTVISGGLAPAPASGPEGEPMRYYGAVDFMTKVYEEAPEGPFDALGFHPYSFPYMPSDSVGWNGWGMMTGPIRDLMRSYGDSHKKIWLTEYGAPTNADHDGVTEADQEAMVVEAFMLARSYDWAGPLFWYSYRDLGDDPAEREDWFGLVRTPEEPKPAYTAFKRMATR
jgi:polysaccharide biosynthesis protein PslG